MVWKKDIKNHEPKVALDGGIDGYNKIRLIIEKKFNFDKKKRQVIFGIRNKSNKRNFKNFKFKWFL